MPEFYDTHAHLDFPDFREEVDEVVQRASDAGISRIVTIGTELESSRRAIDLAKRFDGVFAAVGWHPNDCLSAPDDVRGELEGLAKAAKVVAIGEIGIDHYRLPSTRGGSAADDEAFKARQVSLFQQQLEVAAKLGLNVVVHQRAAFEACIEVFEPFADRVRGVFHCFVNDPAAARRVIDLGSLVSFTGVCTFKNAVEVRESLASVPLDKLMLGDRRAVPRAGAVSGANAANRPTCGKSAKWPPRRGGLGWRNWPRPPARRLGIFSRGWNSRFFPQKPRDFFGNGV